MKISVSKYQEVFKSFSILILTVLLLSVRDSYSQLVVIPSTNYTMDTALVGKVIVGTGVRYSNVTYSGQYNNPASQIGVFSNGNKTNLGLDKGIIMSTGDVNTAILPNNIQNSMIYHNYFCDCEVRNGDSRCTTNIAGCQWRDSDLESILGCNKCTFDAVNLQFDFIPSSNEVNFRYVFASNEYTDYVCSITNDAFAFLVTGPNPHGPAYNDSNIALVPGKKEPVSINTINNGACGKGYIKCSTCDLTNFQYYVNNKDKDSLVYNGFTTVLTSKLDVIPCQKYHIKLALADVEDGAFDSSVFIEAKSFSVKRPTITYQNPGLNIKAAVKGCSDAIITFHTFNHLGVRADSTIQISFNGSTAVSGVDYTTIPANITNSITMLKGDSTYSFNIHAACPATLPGNNNLFVLFNVLTCGIIQTDTIYIKELPQIKATLSPDVTICNGSSTTLSVTSVTGGYGGTNYKYSWSSNPAGFTDNSSNPTVSPAVNTTYTVTITDTCGTCYSNIYSIIVTVDNLKATVSAAGATTFCQGDNVVLNANTGAGFTYQWLGNAGGSLTGETNSSYTANSADTYSVVVTDSTGCSSTSTGITVKIDNPAATITPNIPSGFCAGGSILLKANYITDYSYQWQSGGVNIPGATNSSLNVNSAGSYSFIISKGVFCSATSSTEIISVNSLPVAKIFPEGTLIICNDTSVTLTANFNANYKYQWQKDGNNIDGATNNIFIFTNKGTYSVTETDNNGCSGSDTIKVEVNCPGVILVIPNAFTPTNTMNTNFLPRGLNLKNFSMDIYNRMGGKVFHTDDIEFGWNGRYNGRECPLGVYVYYIKYEGYVENHYEKKTAIGTITLVR